MSERDNPGGTVRRLHPPLPERNHSDGLVALDAVDLASYFTAMRDRAMRQAVTEVRRHDAVRSGKLPDKLLDTVGAAASRADLFGTVADRFSDVARNVHQSITVRSEPRTYGEGSENSFYMDVASAACPGIFSHHDAIIRLQRHRQELTVEAKMATTEGQRALRSAATHARSGGREAIELEQRALSSGTTSGGPFVTPIYLDADYALFRSYPAAFYGQTTKVPDPGFGLKMEVPAFTSGVTVGQQASENTGIDVSSPTAQYLTANLLTFAGEVDVSQQLFDRSGPIGIDKILHAQLAEELMTQIDTYVVTQAMANAGSVSGAGSFTAGGFWNDLATAKAQMLTTAGTVIPASHVFFPAPFADWAVSQSDPSGRPLLLPTAANAALPIQLAPDGGPPPGFTGDRILNMAVFAEGNVAASGSNSRIIVANPAEVFTLTSEPALRAIPETFANELSVSIQLYAYVGVVTRYTNAVQVVTGAAYPASPSF